MSKVAIGSHSSPSRALQLALDDLGFDFVGRIKQVSNICIVASDLLLVESLISAIKLHTRANVYVLSNADNQNIVEGSIPRGEEVRMPIRRPKVTMEAEFVIEIAKMPSDVKRKTEFSIEQFIYSTWLVPPRSNNSKFTRAHDPWLEGELRNEVLADVYAQKPIDLAILDDSNNNAVLVSFDAVAIDSVGMRMLGVDPEDVGYLSKLYMLGLGTSVLSKIDVPLGVIQN